jgi:hypothetical protein
VSKRISEDIHSGGAAIMDLNTMARKVSELVSTETLVVDGGQARAVRMVDHCAKRYLDSTEVFVRTAPQAVLIVSCTCVFLQETDQQSVQQQLQVLQDQNAKTLKTLSSIARTPSPNYAARHTPRPLPDYCQNNILSVFHA